MFLANLEGHVCPLVWKSNKMKRVNKSTLAAEALALQETIDHGLYLRALIRDKLQQDSLALPVQAWIDSANVERDWCQHLK